jgi:hypothetical protein
MKFGQRQYQRDELTRTALGSMVNGTIGGHSKRGMPVVETRRMPLVAEPAGPACLSFTQQSFTSSTSWDVQLSDGEADDFMFAFVMPTVAASATPTGWTEEQFSTFNFGGSRHYWWRKVRADGETSFTVNFGSAAEGSVILVNAQIDPTLPGDSWGGNAYHDLSGDFAGVTEPWNFNTQFGGPYTPDGSIFIMQSRHTGTVSSGPGSPWVLEASGTAGTATHEVWSWVGAGAVDDFTWDTTGSTRDLSFIELAHLCSR